MVKNVLTSNNDDDEAEMSRSLNNIEERGLDHALYDFPDMGARPVESYYLVAKRRHHRMICIVTVMLLTSSMIFLGIVKGAQKSKNNNNDSANKEENDKQIKKSSYNGSPPPIASGDLPNVCDITALGEITGDYSTIKDTCIKECKLGLCCIAVEINDAIKEAGGTQAEEIKSLLSDNKRIIVNDCYYKYELECSKYEPCLNLLDTTAIHSISQEEEDLEIYEEMQIPLADDNLEVICEQKDLNECQALCEAGECCRLLSDKSCTDIFPTVCLGYIPCDVLDYKEQQDKEKAFVEQLCAFEYISTKEGKIQCEAACKAAICCFDVNIDCSIEMEELCDDYKPCSMLGIVAQAENHHINDSNDNNKNNELDLQSENESNQKEEEKELSVKEQIDKTCSTITSYKERDECRLICSKHTCCVDPSEQFGCFTDNDDEYCQDYLSCSYLFPSTTSTSTSNNDE